MEQETQGKIEIEGIYNKAYDRVRKLDLIIRSELRFGDAIKLELQQVYSSVAELMGFAGGLTFQALHTLNVNSPYNPFSSNSLESGIII